MGPGAKPRTVAAAATVTISRLKLLRRGPSQQAPVQIKLSGACSTPELNSRFTFAEFVVGSSNQFAHAAAQAVAELPGEKYNPLFIYGGVGLGKTHLATAIGHHLWSSSSSSRKVLFMPAEAFMNELINSIRRERMGEFKERFRRVNALILDDVHFLAGRERTQEEFFHTFNALHSERHQIILTSDKVPREIPGLEERLRNRFESGLIADIAAPDLETRIAILQKKSALEGLTLPSEVAIYVAQNVLFERARAGRVLDPAGRTRLSYRVADYNRVCAPSPPRPDSDL